VRQLGEQESGGIVLASSSVIRNLLQALTEATPTCSWALCLPHDLIGPAAASGLLTL